MDPSIALSGPATPTTSKLNLARYGLESRTTVVDGAPLHYLEAGEGPVLLFVHGAPAWAFTWRGVIAALRARFRCIAPDLPGFGLSPGGPGSVSLRASSLVLEHFVHSLHLERVILVANDTGGSIGFGAAGRSPERFCGLVAVDTFGYSLREFPQMRMAIRVFSSAPMRWLNRVFNLVPRLVASVGTPGRKFLPDEKRVYLAPFSDVAVRDRCVRLLGSLVREKRYLEEVEANLRWLSDRPLLALFGAMDQARKVGFPEKFAQFFPNFTEHVIPRANHFAHEDAPEQVAALIARWFDERVA
jgi:haloalkane dehalogenase